MPYEYGWQGANYLQKATIFVQHLQALLSGVLNHKLWEGSAVCLFAKRLLFNEPAKPSTHYPHTFMLNMRLRMSFS